MTDIESVFFAGPTYLDGAPAKTNERFPLNGWPKLELLDAGICVHYERANPVFVPLGHVTSFVYRDRGPTDEFLRPPPMNTGEMLKWQDQQAASFSPKKRGPGRPPKNTD